MPSIASIDARIIRRLPLVTLYLTERCNSRCVSCDYWRHGRDDLSLAAVERLLPSLARLQTRIVLLSGGEPLLNRQWLPITRLLRAQGLRTWLLTSGLSLAKHAARACELFDDITVSLDGTDRETYAAIRGLDAFEVVCAGIRAAAARGRAVTLRVTLQRANFRQLPAFVALAHELGARRISFLAVDVANASAFGRLAQARADLSLHVDELAQFAALLAALERDQAAQFDSGFIAESPDKLRRILAHFAAVAGVGARPAVQCNAPEFSAVIGATGQVQPCFFIAGPPQPMVRDLCEALNTGAMLELRAAIRGNTRPECRNCVCSMWRDPADAGHSWATVRS